MTRRDVIRAWLETYLFFTHPRKSVTLRLAWVRRMIQSGRLPKYALEDSKRLLGHELREV